MGHMFMVFSSTQRNVLIPKYIYIYTVHLSTNQGKGSNQNRQLVDFGFEYIVFLSVG